jgi:hypothetical protein
MSITAVAGSKIAEKFMEALGPLSEMVDDLSTSGEERLKFKQAIHQASTHLAQQALAYERALFETQASIILAESQGQSWLQRNWRPLLMCFFALILGWNWIVAPIFGLKVVLPEFPDWFGNVLLVGIGGYIAGRSAEKVTANLSLNNALLRTPADEGAERKTAVKLLKQLRKAKTEEERQAILKLIESLED